MFSRGILLVIFLKHFSFRLAYASGRIPFSSNQPPYPIFFADFILSFVQAMPPVKRTRSARASTRTPKTARAPSRPPAPQEQTANSAPTPSENAGMVNVNLEALTATLSAAVQQAVRAALPTASTPVGSLQMSTHLEMQHCCK